MLELERDESPPPEVARRLEPWSAAIAGDAKVAICPTCGLALATFPPAS
jgi:hypothetical protein